VGDLRHRAAGSDCAPTSLSCQYALRAWLEVLPCSADYVDSMTERSNDESRNGWLGMDSRNAINIMDMTYVSIQATFNQCTPRSNTDRSMFAM